MRMLVAGPGTGKTTGIKNLIASEYGEEHKILVLSFTNATVEDLRNSFEDHENVECHTLHSYALRINPNNKLYILSGLAEENPIHSFAASINQDFDQLCQQLGCISFDMMISKCTEFLENNPVYGEDQIGQLDLLIIDEYQDFNETERQLIDYISSFSSETIFMGDDDQSIYGFKDADPDGIIDRYNSDQIEHIPHENNCYRSADVIVEKSSKLISKNRNRLEKEWHPMGKDGIFHSQQVRSQSDAIGFVINQIKSLREDHRSDEGVSPSFLILSPMRWYVPELVAGLERENLDFVDFWAPPLSEDDYKRIWIIRSILSHRKLLNLIFLYKVLTQHFRKKFRERVTTAIQDGFNEMELYNELIPMFLKSIPQFASEQITLEDFQAENPDWQEITDLIDEEKYNESLDELIKNLKPDIKFDQEKVNVMSIHKSKGLQADVVFVMNLVDGVLPNNTRGADTIEAQRRLLFVAMTRAKSVLMLVSPVEWTNDVVHRVDKSQFKYDWNSKKYKAVTSSFIGEMQ